MAQAQPQPSINELLSELVSSPAMQSLVTHPEMPAVISSGQAQVWFDRLANTVAGNLLAPSDVMSVEGRAAAQKICDETGECGLSSSVKDKRAAQPASAPASKPAPTISAEEASKLNREHNQRIKQEAEMMQRIREAQIQQAKKQKTYGDTTPVEVEAPMDASKSLRILFGND